MRTRRRLWLSETRPSIHEPYSGVSGTRPLWLGHPLQHAAQPLRHALVGGHRGVSLIRRVRASMVVRVRLVIAQCTVDYVGRLTAHLPSARRLLLFKADGSVSVHADDRAYKPLNWMSPPCWLDRGERRRRRRSGWSQNKAGEQLRITVEDIEHDSSHELGRRPGTGQGRRGGAPAGAARRARRTARRRLHAGAPRVHDAPSDRSTCCAATSRAARWPWRSSGAARSTASNS